MDSCIYMTSYATQENGNVTQMLTMFTKETPAEDAPLHEEQL